MHLDVSLLSQSFRCQELSDVIALVSLDLNDFSMLFVRDNSTITTEIFLEGLEDFLEIQLGIQALHSGQAFATISLLRANMHVVNFFLRFTGIFSFRKWVYSHK